MRFTTHAFIGVVLLIFLGSCSLRGKTFSNTADTAPSHQLWDELLKRHVDKDGWVDYKGFIKDSMQLNAYLHLLSNSAPNPKSWTESERLAYWINAYNAFTVQIVIRNYPVKSIKDIAGKLAIPFISSTWDIAFIQIGGDKIDLNRIEHGILRKEFNEPRIHFAINCASISCPVLRNEAFTPALLEKQLEDQARRFINDPAKNVFTSRNEAKLSKIFSWFSGDFKSKDSSIIDFINPYLKVPLSKKAKITYLEYNWGLNERP